MGLILETRGVKPKVRVQGEDILSVDRELCLGETSLECPPGSRSDKYYQADHRKQP